jgi:hypothetical protein
MEKAFETPTGYPSGVEVTHEGLNVSMLAIAEEEFLDAFDFLTLERHQGAPAWNEAIPWHQVRGLRESAFARPPAGIIFHHARTGSTLVARLLRCAGVQVYSEPPCVNDLLMPPVASSRAHVVSALGHLAIMLSQHCTGPYIIKLRSWNTLYADAIVEAYPDAPWTFIARDPVEAAVSVLRKPPTWVRERERFVERARDFGPVDSPEEYVATMIAAFASSIEAIAGPLGLLVQYDQLPEAVVDMIAPHFGFEPAPEMRERMIKEASFYSKSRLGGATCFLTDSAEKQATASHRLREAVATIAAPALNRLLRGECPLLRRQPSESSTYPEVHR